MSNDEVQFVRLKKPAMRAFDECPLHETNELTAGVPFDCEEPQVIELSVAHLNVRIQ